MNVIKIGQTRQLLLDDHVIEEQHNLHRKLHRPVRCSSNPLLVGDRLWEGMGVDLFGGTILYDEEECLFKMWYRTATLPHATAGGYQGKFPGLPHMYKALYAISEDGVQWMKVPLRQFQHEGSLENNIISPGQVGRGWIRRPNLVKDLREPNPDRRYKMLYIDDLDSDAELVDHTTGRLALRKAYSPDGIHWSMNVGWPTVFEPPISPHGVLFGWDPKIERFVHYHIRRSPLPADVDGRFVRGERTIMRSTSPDFEHWGDTQQVIALDDHYDPPNMNVGHIGVMTAILYGDLYVGFLDTMQTLDVADVAPHLWEAYASQDSEQKTELIVSRDGLHWKRVQPHWGFFGPGLWGAWDREIAALSTPIVADDEILFYYTGSNLPQNSISNEHPQSSLWGFGKMIDGQRAGFAIGLATLRLDGFASLDNYDDVGGQLTTRPLIFEGRRLTINVRAPQVGSSEVRVELLGSDGLPLAGYSAEESDPFGGDEIRHIVTWDGRDDLPGLAGQPVRLRFHLRKAALYAFQFTD